LTRDPQAHLSPEELAFLSGERESGSGGDYDPAQSEAHAESCSTCDTRLRSYRSLQANLRKLAVFVAAKQTSECPSVRIWSALAAGRTSVTEARNLLAHASKCDHCGPMLRAATQEMNPETSAEEQNLIRLLPSADAAWQRALAEKMSRVASSRAVTPDTAATIESSAEEAKAEEDKYPRSTTRLGWIFPNWKSWVIPVSAGAIIAVAAVLFFQSSPSISEVNELIAQSYGAQRPFEARFPGAKYSPLREERGEVGPSRSRMDEPAELLEAEKQIARVLAHHPREPKWRQAKARTDVFEGNYQLAIEELTKLQADRPGDVTIQFDLAIAYYGRARTQRDAVAKATDFQFSLRSLNVVLGQNPNNAVALFDRALVYKQLKQYSEANSDWHRYLQLDPSGPWADEALRQMQDKGLER
jgi:tetratricopeptide (TPR) repeat protein